MTKKAIAILLAVLFIVTVGISTADSPPSADFTWSQLKQSAPSGVRFTDLSTGDPFFWYWQFGDGGTSTAKNPSHVYTRRGFYTVTLTIIAYYHEAPYNTSTTKYRCIAVS